jgi:eukaryotic-like serine/threonine-protein kinase
MFHATLTALSALPPPLAQGPVLPPAKAPPPSPRPPAAVSLKRRRTARHALPPSSSGAGPLPPDGAGPAPSIPTESGSITLPSSSGGGAGGDIFPGVWELELGEERKGDESERGQAGTGRPTHTPHPTSLSPSLLPGEFPPGTVLASPASGTRYRIDRLLGRGSNGVTYEATPLPPAGDGGSGGGGGSSDASTTPTPTTPPPSPVALKAVSLRGAGGWKRIELFEREASTLASLSHPGIPAYREFFTLDTPSDRAFVLVQELVSGRTLARLVSDGPRGSLSDVTALAKSLLSILAYLAGRAPPLTHRDVKPENIVLEGGAWGGAVRLVDFGGVAAAGADAEASVSGDVSSSASYGPDGAVFPATAPFGTTVVGTYGYMPPEQFRGRASPASDIYALGGVLLFALTGRPPSAFPQGRGLRLDLSGLEEAVGGAGPEGDALIDLVEAALEPEAEDRPSAAEALAALDGATSGVPGRPGVLGGSAFPGSGGGGGRQRRRRAAAATDTALTARRGGAPATTTTLSTRPSPSNPRSTSAPPGARSILSRSGRSLTVDVPPAPVLAAERAGSAAFALMWNGTIALWTASALAAGSLLAAAFSLPFWVAGAAVARDALGGSLARERLELGPRRWTLLRERAVGSLGFGKKKAAKALPGASSSAADPSAPFGGSGGEVTEASGRVGDLRGARVAITSIVNGVPRTRLELLDGFNAIPFGEGLSGAEQRWLARVINAHIEDTTGAPPDVPPDDEAPPPSVVVMGPGPLLGPPGTMGGGWYGPRGPFDPWV